jgi:hypothetical protein
VVPRTGLEDVETNKFLPLPGIELRSLGHPASSQSLYRLLYKPCYVFIFKQKEGTCTLHHSTYRLLTSANLGFTHFTYEALTSERERESGGDIGASAIMTICVCNKTQN